MTSRAFRIIIIPLAYALFSPAIANGTGVIPVGQREFDFIYDRMERIEAQSLDRTGYQLGPYSFDLPCALPAPLRTLIDAGPDRLALFAVAGESFRSRRGVRALGLESFRGGLSAQPINDLFVYGNFVLDEQRAKDPYYTGKKWRGLAGDVEQAFATYQHKGFTFTAGRFASFWGNRHSLVLSPPATMDGFSYSIRWGRLVLSYRTAKLDGRIDSLTGGELFENRYFAGHRLDVNLNSNVRVGLFETVIYGGEGRAWEPAYLNPLMFFHGFQLNDKTNDNTFLGFDFSYKPRPGCHLYGQLVVDDFQIERKTQADQEPNELAYLVGLYMADVSEGWDLKAEYSRVTNRTFNQVLSRNRHISRGQLIGGALGNDYDLTSISVMRWHRQWLRSALNLRYLRQGEGSVTADWSEPWLDVSGDYREPFPTGIVQKTAGASVGLTGYIRDLFFVDFEAGVDRVRNFEHTAGDNRTLPFVKISLSAIVAGTVGIR